MRCWWGCKLVQPRKTGRQFLNKVNTELLYDPAIPPPGTHPKELKTATRTGIRTPSPEATGRQRELGQKSGARRGGAPESRHLCPPPTPREGQAWGFTLAPGRPQGARVATSDFSLVLSGHPGPLVCWSTSRCVTGRFAKPL